jgi:hypothetical protein
VVALEVLEQLQTLLQLVELPHLLALYFQRQVAVVEQRAQLRVLVTVQMVVQAEQVAQTVNHQHQAVQVFLVKEVQAVAMVQRHHHFHQAEAVELPHPVVLALLEEYQATEEQAETPSQIMVL